MGYPSQLHSVFQPVEVLTKSQPKTGEMEKEGGAAAPFPSIVHWQMRAVCASVLRLIGDISAFTNIFCAVARLRVGSGKSPRYHVKSGVECVKQ